jgi:hypothetical protein
MRRSELSDDAQRKRIADLEAYAKTLRAALLPFAQIGRTVTPEMAAGDVWLAAARRAAEVAFGKKAKERSQ